MEITNKLERGSATLYRDGSKESLDLERSLKDFGYDLTTILSGSPTPVLNCPGNFLFGYNQIERFIDR